MNDQNPEYIRTYQPSDRQAVLELNAYGLAAAGVPEDADVYGGDLDDVTTTYLTGRATLLVAELAGEVIAMGALRPIDATTCEITRMRVTPEYQGCGHGKRMLAALEDRAKELGYSQAVLLTGPNQHPAIDLYQAAGYVTTAIERHGELEGIRMHKRLVSEPTRWEKIDSSQTAPDRF